MLGYFDYTVWLTYISLISAGIGIIVSLDGSGHPYIGLFFLMISGLCDTFDGKVARTKKERTEMQMKYGIQIDSLADMVAFGVLPACIGNAMIRVLPTIPEYARNHTEIITRSPWYQICVAIMLFYILMALIRLAYFNVMEEERQDVEKGCRKFYQGLPVTSVALIFPMIMVSQYILPMDITPWYFAALLLVGCLFVSKINVPKPNFWGILIMVGLGTFIFSILAIHTFILK